MSILILNGSLGGSQGNTGHVLSRLTGFLGQQVDQINLADTHLALPALETRLREADGFVFATGTYWDSWGSPLQRFFEETTALEAGDLWLGKPAACIVTMHSVGGKEVLSRLQGVLCTLGLALPPMSGLTYSLANHFALQSEAAARKGFTSDLWQLTDLEVIAHNLLEALKPRETPHTWRTWPVDTADPHRIWI
jgi:multimeric flavodoxin WrbA